MRHPAMAWGISLRCSDSISSPRTGVEAILTELGPENQNWRYAASSYIAEDDLTDTCCLIVYGMGWLRNSRQSLEPNLLAVCKKRSKLLQL
jgi:hypothetical protein